jgi:drug/metabolite transporter (DMT)-like permease
MTLSPNMQGALLMMGSMAAFTVNDTFIKATGGAVPLFQLIALRGVLATAFLILLALRLRKLTLRASRHDWALAVARGLAETGAAYFFLTALMNMPIANVTAILQSLPFTVSLGAALVFRERIGWRRMTAILIGFAGMLLIVRPGAAGYDLYALYALVAVFFVTVRDLVTRRISPAMPSMTVTAVSSIIVTVFAAAMALPGGWTPIDTGNLVLILGASVTVIVAYLLSVLVMRVGEVSFVAPFRYSGLLWALGLGWAVFGEWPDPLTLLGAGIIVGSGLFMFYRETALRPAG